VLIDRLWPRGIKKERLRLDGWVKELAPTTELRKEFGHNPKLWEAFEAKYKKELKSPAAKEKLKALTQIANERDVTLVYGAKDEEHNDAVVLKRILERGSKIT